nr:unnamed protein product [Callosobruchus chinensis]
MWVPSHINIPRNELADAAAKRAAHSSPDESILTPSIQTNINKWNYPRSLNCRQKSVLCRLRIGPCRLIHSYLLSGDLRPMCSVCNVRLTVDHLLIECQFHCDIRRELQMSRNIQTLLRDEWQKISIFLIHTNTFLTI